MGQNIKKILLGVAALVLVAFSFIRCDQPEVGMEGVLERARKEIPVAGIEEMELTLVGETRLDDKCLFWFMVGNEHQAQKCYPLEFRQFTDTTYGFIKTFNPVERGVDAWVLEWQNGYSFMVTNPDCTQIRMDGETVEVEAVPFEYYSDTVPHVYQFLDAEGKEL